MVPWFGDGEHMANQIDRNPNQFLTQPNHLSPDPNQLSQIANRDTNQFLVIQTYIPFHANRRLVHEVIQQQQEPVGDYANRGLPVRAVFLCNSPNLSENSRQMSEGKTYLALKKSWQAAHRPRLLS